jgi:hypothetical protein
MAKFTFMWDENEFEFDTSRADELTEHFASLLTHLEPSYDGEGDDFEKLMVETQREMGIEDNTRISIDQAVEYTRRLAEKTGRDPDVCEAQLRYSIADGELPAYKDTLN